MLEGQIKSSMHEHILYSRNNAKFLLWLIVRTLLILFIASLFGISFMLIAQGIILTSFYLAFFWYPAFIIIARLVNLDTSNIQFNALKTNLLHASLWLIQILIFGSPVIFGVWLLFSGGFLNQNLFYLILR